MRTGGGAEAGSIAGDGSGDLAMLQLSGGDDQGVAGNVMVVQLAEQVAATHRIERLLGAGDGPAKRLVRPKRGVE